MPENDKKFSLMDAYHFGYEVALSACGSKADPALSLGFIHLLVSIAEGKEIIQNAPADSRAVLRRLLKETEEDSDQKSGHEILRKYLEKDEKVFVELTHRDQELARRILKELQAPDENLLK